MITFAFVDENGIPTRGGRLRAMPDGAVPLPEPFTALDLPRLRYVDGAWEERTDLPPPEDAERSAEDVAIWQAAMLDRARAAAADRINARVGDLRKRFLTDIPGQVELYADKRREAVAYLREVQLTGEPATLDAYELIADELGITAATALQIAQLWLARSTATNTAVRRSERVRQIALKAVAAARDDAAIQTIETQFNEALNGLPL